MKKFEKICPEVDNFKKSMSYYNLISEMFDEEIRYISGYKSIINEYFKKTLNLQMSSGSKLGKLPEGFSNSTLIDSSAYLKLTQQIPKIIQKQIEFLSIFLSEVEKSLTNLDDFLKNKSSEIKRYQQKYDEVNKDLMNQYIENKKAEIAFLNSINKSEDIIMKSLENKIKIEEAKNGKINDAELKLLNDKNKEYESQKNSQINSTKKCQNEFINIIKVSEKIEDKFISEINKSIVGIKKVVDEMTDKLKNTILIFLSSFKESFKCPLELIENNLSSMAKKDEKEILNKALEATFNNESKFEHLTTVRYNLKCLENTKNENIKRDSKGSNGKNKNKNKEKNDKSQKGFIKFEDGFEEMGYFEDDLIFLTVKEMFNNFELINHNGLNIKIEEEKNEAKKYANKLISNMSKETNQILNEDNFINIHETSSFTEIEKDNLKKLLNKHHNRVIFLHKLNDYRTSNLFELKEKEFLTLVDLFSFLIDISRKEKDYHCIEMIIILSKTYYKLEKSKKIYIQDLIKNHEIFKTKELWEELLIYSISKEVIRSKKKNEDKINKDESLTENNSNIVFSQLLSLIDNMFDFDVEEGMIKQIIEFRIEFYKVNNELKKTIIDLIDSKIKAKRK